jgi:hypothetical protein
MNEADVNVGLAREERTVVAKGCRISSEHEFFRLFIFIHFLAHPLGHFQYERDVTQDGVGVFAKLRLPGSRLIDVAVVRLQGLAHGLSPSVLGPVSFAT